MNNFLPSFCFVVYLFATSCLFGQNQKSDSHETPDSRNGYILPVSGRLHILLIFAEVVYDKGTDPVASGGTVGWKSGRLPTWKDKLFDPSPTNEPQGIFTKFFQEMSFGNFIVTGDYLINKQNPDIPVQIPASGKITVSEIFSKASEFPVFMTKHSGIMQDFDNWTLTSPGLAKITPSNDNPMKYDHVMVIIRNSTFPTNLSGWTSSGSQGRLFGCQQDSYSFFCASNILPFNIMVHEFSHSLFGGNNFHAGGSHSKKAGYSYFPSIQGGWGMMGAAGRSLLTCNAWERRRLGWIPKNKKYEISTLDSTGRFEISSDIGLEQQEQEYVFMIRDFVTTGDAIRIRLPFIPENQFQQWLWIENHQTETFNNSQFDKFQYYDETCTDKAQAGLYVYMQVDKEKRQGNTIFEGYADYLRPLPANGMYDIVFGDTLVQNQCVNTEKYYPYQLQKQMQNPLSGFHELENFLYDLNMDGKITAEEQFPPTIRKEQTVYIYKLPNLGSKEMVFTKNGNKRIGIGTNPSSANMLTNVSTLTELKDNKVKNNRTVYLNGISVEIIENTPVVPGAMLVRVRFDDYSIDKNMRWCADTIILPSRNNSESRVLHVKQKVQLKIDRGLSPTGFVMQDYNQHLFSKPSVFILKPNTCITLASGASLFIENGSTIILESGSTIRLEHRSRLILRNCSKVIVKKGAKLDIQKRAKVKYSGNCKIQYEE